MAIETLSKSVPAADPAAQQLSAWVQGQLAGKQNAISLLLGPIVAGCIWILPLGLDPLAQKALSIAAFMVIYWVTEPIDHGITALIGCYLFWALGVATFSAAFSGFTNSTPWFLFGALLMGEAASRTGLAKRIGFTLMQKFGSSYAQILFGLIALSFLLNFFVPSGMARLAIMAPIAIGIIKGFNVGIGSNIGKGIFVVLTYTSGLFDCMILSGAASIFARGLAEEQAGIQILWSQWLVAFFPAALGTIFVAVPVITWLFPAERTVLPNSQEYYREALRSMGPWTAVEKRALGWFILGLSLWATDFVHRISPPVIGLGIGLLLTLPKIGVLDSKTVRQMNFLLIAFSAGALSMATVLMNTEVLPVMASGMVRYLEPWFLNPFSYVALLYLAGVSYHFLVANRQSMLSTSLPVLLHFAMAGSYDVTSLVFLWTFTGGSALFIYQSAIYLVGYSYGYFNNRDFMKVGAIFTIIQGMFLVTLVLFYWPLIGLSPINV